MLRFRLKSPAGTVKLQMPSPSSLGELRAAIKDVTSIPEHRQILLAGFPPTVVDGKDATELVAAGLSSGSTITVALAPPGAPRPGEFEKGAEVWYTRSESDLARPGQEVAGVVVATHNDDGADLYYTVAVQGSERQTPATRLRKRRDSTTSTPAAGSAAGSAAVETAMRRHAVDADNSCLFNCIGFLLEDGTLSMSTELRQLAAGAIISEPERYSDAVLGKPAAEYCAWIQQPDRWGGAIELSIFADMFSTEIVAVDVETAVPHFFGQDKGFGRRCFVIYDGIHYDPIVRGAAPLERTFASTDPVALAQAVAVATDAKEKRQFVNTANFQLQCINCGTPLKGQTEAQAHAKATGHGNFCEIGQG